MYSVESQRKNVNCSSCRFREQESKVSYKHAGLDTVKVKKKRIFRPAHCSLCPLCSREGEREKRIPLFLFFSLQYHLRNPFESWCPTYELWELSYPHLLLNFLICKWEKYSIGKTQTTVPRPKKSRVHICSMNICSDWHFHIRTWWDYLKILS